MRRRFRKRKRCPMYNGFLLIFILFLFVLILIQRIRIDRLLDCEDCLVPNSEAEIAVMAREGDTETAVMAEEGNTEIAVMAGEGDDQTVPMAEDADTTGQTSVTESSRKQQAGLEEKVAYIAAKEIGAGAEKATIQAQCVLARTRLYDADENKSKEPEGISQSEMQEIWGTDWEKTLQLFEECALETRGEILTYGGDYIYAAYHAVSAGTTRNMAEMYPQSDMPYLSEVSCSKDASAKGYLAVLYWEKSEFLEKCRQLSGNTEIADLSQIQITERDSADYVLTVQIGNDTYSGEAFRNHFTLNSACFTITDLENNVRIVTKGIGHGFGMSQNTANSMAAGGSSYQEILAAFFPKAVLENMK